jgi:hypothetical protein
VNLSGEIGNLSEYITLDGQLYRISELSEAGQRLVANLQFTRERISTLSNRHALLIRAKNGYVSDLNIEILESKTGIDLGQLLQED